MISCMRRIGPVLTPHELDRTEIASRKAEIERLLKMKVLEEVPELPPEAKMLQTRHVMDSRFREGRWIRRARLVMQGASDMGSESPRRVCTKYQPIDLETSTSHCCILCRLAVDGLRCQGCVRDSPSAG